MRHLRCCFIDYVVVENFPHSINDVKHFKIYAIALYKIVLVKFNI